MNTPGIKPNKRLGQHFLRSPAVIEKICTNMAVSPGDTVIEIGPGEGVLTEQLAHTGAQIVAVEKDRRLADMCAERFAACENVSVVSEDILQFDMRPYVPPGKKVRVAGNVPYNITSPILFYLMERRMVVADATLMVQKEVGERLTSRPGTKSYGIPTVLFIEYADVSRLFCVGKSNFFPQPAVDSMVVHIGFLEEPRYALKDTELFFRVVKATFGKRRKMLRNTVKQLIPAEYMDTLSIDLSKRPEQLHVEEFVRLANEICLYMR